MSAREQELAAYREWCADHLGPLPTFAEWRAAMDAALAASRLWNRLFGPDATVDTTFEIGRTA